MFPSSLVRGRRPEAFLKVDRGRRSRGCVRSAVSGGAETARRALRPVREELVARWPGGNAGPRKRGTASENRRWSAERRASPIARGRGRLARARPVLATRARGSRKPPRRLGAPPPLIGRRKKRDKTRAQQRAAGTKKLVYPP